MWAHALSTLRASYRLVGCWLLLAFGLFAAWFGSQMSVLALGEVSSQARDVVASTASSASALAALWLLSVLLDEDRRDGFGLAAEQTAPGVAGRLLGRWLGATIAGGLVGGTVLLLSVLLGGESLPSGSLLITTIISPAHVAAIGLLFGARGGGALALAAGTLLFVAGRIPWGTHGLLEGRAGAALAALLPSEDAGARSLAHAGYTALTVCGLLLVGLALTPRAGSGE